MKKTKIFIIIIILHLFLLVNFSLCSSARYNKGKAEDFFKDEAVLQLVKAAEKGNIKKIEEALAKGTDINAVSKDKRAVFTPLIWAYSKMNKKGYESLLKKGADPNYYDKEGYSLMYYTVFDKDPFYLETALKYGGNTNTIDTVSDLMKDTILFTAISNYRIEYVMLLIKAGADLNYQNYIKETPIMRAALNNFYDIVYILLQSGADPLLKNSVGRSLITFLEEKNINTKHPMYNWYIKVVELLRSRGIKVNVEL